MISAIIFTLNEELNLPHCLKSLKDCDDVVVLDSFSSDRTCEIARSAGARVFQHEFTGFGDQRMWAFQNISFSHPWVLVLDADERLTEPLWQEMQKSVGSCSPDIAAFRLKRRFYWNGRWLSRANLYPTWVVRLVRPDKTRYINRGHAETQEVDGKIESLAEDLIDENHKGLEEWRKRQRKYAETEAAYEVASSKRFLPSNLWSMDPMLKRDAWKSLGRILPFRGFCYFVYSYFLRSGWIDGWTGFRFCLEKASFQSHISKTVKKLRNQ